ncbi:hypothetical protein C8263_00820 [Deinococcus arcticus]|uniref:Uncharacterized protein n=1 Tax=Deinococcus arcticus TaxID=2136176 RepID=A0A2T3WD82_9DEIO|nr:hypothetical protein C8263_00820 [Deinococcus arcticus]
MGPEQLAQGRSLTLATLWALFLLSVLPSVAGLVQGQTGDLLRQALYAGATAFLLGMVWRGSVWAWRLTVSFGMLAGLLVFVVGMLAGGSSWRGWVVSVAGLGYLVLATALVGTPSIRAFLDRRWAARRPV